MAKLVYNSNNCNYGLWMFMALITIAFIKYTDQFLQQFTTGRPRILCFNGNPDTNALW